MHKDIMMFVAGLSTCVVWVPGGGDCWGKTCLDGPCGGLFRGWGRNGTGPDAGVFCILAGGLDSVLFVFPELFCIAAAVSAAPAPTKAWPFQM